MHFTIDLTATNYGDLDISIEGAIVPGSTVNVTVTGNVDPSFIAAYPSISTLEYLLAFEGIPLYQGKQNVAELLSWLPASLPEDVTIPAPITEIVPGLPTVPPSISNMPISAIAANVKSGAEGLMNGETYTYTHPLNIPAYIPAGTYYAAGSAKDALGNELICYQVLLKVGAKRALRQ